MKDDDLAAVYRAPEAALREDILPRGWVHPFAGFAGGLAGMLALQGSVFVPRTVSSAIIGGAVLLCVRRLPWHVAALLGFPLAMLAYVGISVLIAYVDFG